MAQKVRISPKLIDFGEVDELERKQEFAKEIQIQNVHTSSIKGSGLKMWIFDNVKNGRFRPEVD